MQDQPQISRREDRSAQGQTAKAQQVENRIDLARQTAQHITFASEAIVGLIDHYRSTAYLCLSHLTDEDIIDNIAAAAERANVPLTIWNNQGAAVLGMEEGSADHDALLFALARPLGVRAAEYAAAAGVSITNASSRFKRLWEKRILLRTRASAPSGGAEFVYRPIG